MVMVLGTGIVSHAGMLACPPIYLGGTQNLAYVFVFNAGTAPVTVLSKQILDQSGNEIPLTSDSSWDTIGPGEHKRFASTSIGNYSYAARVVVDGSAETLRAVLQIKQSGTSLIMNSPLTASR